MTSSSVSTALVPYDPTLPHISLQAHLETAADEEVRRSFEVAKFKSKHLSLEGRLIYLAQHLPKMLPFPFSGVIALQAGNGLIVQVCHCPHQAEFTADQPFNALSVGKLFTATAVIQLIEDGKFSLKTHLGDLLTEDELDLPLQSPYQEQKPLLGALDDLKKHAAKITVEHLLSHTAGFIDRPGSESEGIAPGEGWDPTTIGNYNYSNYGYQLLAMIVGKHTNSGMPFINHEARFRAHIERRIFKPAGMEGAIRESNRLVDGVYPPARNQPDCFEISEHGEPRQVVTTEPYPHGNGGWRMTATDLLAFMRAIHQHNILIKEDSFQTMKNHKSRHLGFNVDPDRNGYGRPGNGPGMSSFIHTWRTNPPITAVVLSNYSGCEDVKPFLDPLMNL